MPGISDPPRKVTGAHSPELRTATSALTSDNTPGPRCQRSDHYGRVVGVRGFCSTVLGCPAGDPVVAVQRLRYRRRRCLHNPCSSLCDPDLCRPVASWHLPDRGPHSRLGSGRFCQACADVSLSSRWHASFPALPFGYLVPIPGRRRRPAPPNPAHSTVSAEPCSGSVSVGCVHVTAARRRTARLAREHGARATRTRAWCGNVGKRRGLQGRRVRATRRYLPPWVRDACAYAGVRRRTNSRPCSGLARPGGDPNANPVGGLWRRWRANFCLAE